MSKVDIVKRSYVAFAAGDMEGVLGDMHPEIEWHQAQGLPHGGNQVHEFLGRPRQVEVTCAADIKDLIKPSDDASS